MKTNFQVLWYDQLQYLMALCALSLGISQVVLMNSQTCEETKQKEDERYWEVFDKSARRVTKVLRYAVYEGMLWVYMSLKAGSAAWRTRDIFQSRVTPSLFLSREHMTWHWMISCLHVPSASQPSNTMLSTDRSVGTHGQTPTRVSHTCLVGKRNDLMLFPQVKPNHFNNDQDKQEVIKHWHNVWDKTCGASQILHIYHL